MQLFNLTTVSENIFVTGFLGIFRPQTFIDLPTTNTLGDTKDFQPECPFTKMSLLKLSQNVPPTESKCPSIWRDTLTQPNYPTDNKIRNDLCLPGSEKTPENRSKLKAYFDLLFLHIALGVGYSGYY